MHDTHPEVAVADVLTPLAMSILQAGGDQAYTRLVVRGGTPVSGGSADARRLLKDVEPQQLIGRPVADAEAATAVLAALWLWHDCLDESHQISQALISPTGSFWHAIMHRREGDFWNSKYWYARCRSHSVMRTIAVGATPIVGNPSMRATQGIDGNGWDPGAYVDWVEEIHEHPNNPGYNAAVELQKLEWRTLFADCAFAAAGAGSLLGGGMES